VSIALFVIAGFMVWGSLINISRIGLERTPSTPRTVAIATFINAAIITILVLSAILLLP